VKKLFSILFILVLVVSLGLATASPVLADSRAVTPGWTDIDQVAAGVAHTVGVKNDGTVVAVGYNGDGQCDVGDWTNIDQVAAGEEYTVGLKSDNTVVAIGGNDDGQCEVSSWSAIDQVAAGAFHTVGLRSDGTAVAVGNNDNGQCNVGGWTNITQVAAGGLHTVGLQSDGTVVAVGSNGDGQCNVGAWTDITQVAAGDSHTVGLRSDGTVVAVGYNAHNQCDVGGWTGIIQVAAGGAHTVGLRSDGTVIAVGNNGDGQCDIGAWTSIDQVAAGRDHTVGVTSGDIVVAAGNNDYGQCGGIVTQTVTNDIVDAIDEADTIVEVHNGTATVTIFKYEGNPYPETPIEGEGELASLNVGTLQTDTVAFADVFRDVKVTNSTVGTWMTIKIYYTDKQIEGIDDENTLRACWTNAVDPPPQYYLKCSHSDVVPYPQHVGDHDYSGYIQAIVKKDDTSPRMDQLTGTTFGGYGSGADVPTPGCGPCFIATAAYGSDTAEQLDVLREFRDEVLLPNIVGAKFVSFYYNTSPPIADFISQNEVLRTAVRVGFVDPIVKILDWTHDLWSP